MGFIDTIVAGFSSFNRNLRNRAFLVLAPVTFFLMTVWALAEEGSAPALPAGSAPAAGGAAAGSAVAQQPGGMFATLAPFAIMLLVFYFFMIRPQQKKVKEQQAMLGALQYGDEVVTASGVFGKVAGLTEKVVTLEVSDNVKIKILRSQVSQVLKGPLKDITV